MQTTTDSKQQSIEESISSLALENLLRGKKRDCQTLSNNSTPQFLLLDLQQYYKL